MNFLQVYSINTFGEIQKHYLDVSKSSKKVVNYSLLFFFKTLKEYTIFFQSNPESQNYPNVCDPKVLEYFSLLNKDSN